MIHVHGPSITLEELRDIPCPRPPGAGRAWQGVPHGVLVDAILDEIRSRGWVCNGYKFSHGYKFAHRTHPTRALLVGAFDLAIPALPAPDGQTLSLGVINSNDQSTALRLMVGTVVSVCTNGMATGEIVLRHKHTTRFDLHAGIERGLDVYASRAAAIHGVVASLRGRRVVDRDAVWLLVNAARQRYVAWDKLGIIDTAYRSPAHAAMHGYGTAWSLLNAFTGVAKVAPPRLQMQQINGFRELLMA